MKIKFIGAAQEVTGSKHLITTDHGKKILLDCGMFQGKGLETDASNRNTMVNPADVDYIILTHAHIDHSGLIPYFYKQGFRGHVFCTAATRDLCSIMLADSGFIQENDMVWFNKKRRRQGLPALDPIYTEKDARACMETFVSVAYNRYINIDSNIKVKFNNTGHMLGSGCVILEIDEGGKMTRIGYTGDIGRQSSYLLKSPEPFPHCDYLITESTYGDRLHSDRADAEKQLLDIIHHTCIQKKGKLLIPSFAIGRTQEVVYILNNFYNEGKLPEKIPVFVDSPLAVNATDIFRMHLELFNKDVAEVIENDPDPFGFNSLTYVRDVNQSKLLNNRKDPCIIISASGMMEAGRIKHHIANNIANPKTSLLAIGYCAPSTLGAKILSKPTPEAVSIFGNEYSVKADIYEIDAFSGHGDYSEMLEYLKCQDPGKIRKTFLVHGDPEAQKFYKRVLRKAGWDNIEIPEPGETFELK
ncbi:MAG: MBL fold metallo-hydrolase RNA specificity domain-containing protein [Candidatus Limimorpha sp.]